MLEPRGESHAVESNSTGPNCVIPPSESSTRSSCPTNSVFCKLLTVAFPSVRYDAFENAVHEVAERVDGKHPPCGMPSWVSDKTIKLREGRDKAKRVFLQSQTTRTKVAWRKLNSSLNLSYERDRTEALHRQIDELCTAEEKGDYSTTWKVVLT